MRALTETGKYEIHNISYSGIKANYKEVDGVSTHLLPYAEKRNKRPAWLTRLILLLKMPIYPFVNPFNCRQVYKATREIIRDTHFDLVICQCNPEESLWTGVWLKKQGHIDQLMVIFWDNIYGKLPRRVIPKGFALRRQRWAEGIAVKYADRVVSLYPIKAFHDQYGELPQAIGKRSYLGIPSVIRPDVMPMSPSQDAIVEGKINILYSGTIFREGYVKYLVDLLNATSLAENINLIFFQKGVSSDKWEILKANFKGSIYMSSWIPLSALLALYPKVDFFMSYPGNPTAIRSKLFEYVSFSKPLLLLYDDDSDVNITTFSIYPACHCVDVRQAVDENAPAMSEYLEKAKKITISFEKTEKLFIKDSPQAYIELIENELN